MLRNKLEFLLIILMAVFAITNCSKDDNGTNPVAGNDSRLVGTWNLTRISIPIIDSTATPQEAGIAITQSFNSNGTFTSTSTMEDSVSNDAGTWNTVDNTTLTLNFDDGTSQAGTYAINGNIATLNWTFFFDIVGSEIPVVLEFTKQ